MIPKQLEETANTTVISVQHRSGETMIPRQAPLLLSEAPGLTLRLQEGQYVTCSRRDSLQS